MSRGQRGHTDPEDDDPEEFEGPKDFIKRPPKYQKKNQCPEFCGLFNCIVKENCGNECNKLDLAKASICSLCDNDCDKERKRVLLGTDYYQHIKVMKTADIMEKLERVREKHMEQETLFKEVSEQFSKTPGYNFPARQQLSSRGKKIKYAIEIYREIMEELGIKYDKVVDM